MYNYARNNYHKNPKKSDIQTPPEVSQFIFELLRDKTPSNGTILDPCSGQGNLLKPWFKNNYPIFGIDIKDIGKGKWSLNWTTPNIVTDFLTLTLKKINCWPGLTDLTLILCNPPFNGYGKKLGSEVWLDKIIELFGKEVPIVLFAPAGFCLNQTLTSERKMKFENGTYPPIISRITLPKDIFEGVVFHSEVLIFNVKGLEPHYFYSKK